ncbi:MAG: DUF4652 domain-containing protein [Clostridia bacterium]|nr:DUF4652 domain-containing protein [Clostridia bacterium]
MKKLFVCLAVLLLALSVVSCTTQTVLPDVSSSPAESVENSVPVEPESSVVVEESSGALEATSSEEETSSEEPAMPKKEYVLFAENGVRVKEHYDETNNYTVRYYITDENGEWVEFHREEDIVDGNTDVYGFGNARRVILNNHTWEEPSDVYLYEAATGEKRQLDMSGLPRNELVTTMRWLDGRYFLFVSQFDHGTVAIGGDVWVYDTETDEYFRIIAREDGYMQIADMTVYDGMVLFHVPYYIDDAYSDTEMHYYTLSTKEIYELIDTRNEITFRVGEWLH